MKYKRIATLVLTAMLAVAAFSVEAKATETNIASGTVDEEYGQITWVIDSEGKLTVTGTGDVSDSTAGDRVPWHQYCKEITSAEIVVTGMTDASNLFFLCSNLTKVDISGFDTSSVTNMMGMFWGCSSLAELDVSHFATSKVTDISYMFYLCQALTDLDVSSFETNNVTNMGYMFGFCDSLQTLNVSSFDTSGAVYMDGMFCGCSSLQELDLSSFDMSNAGDMSYVFSDCSNLEQIEAPLNCSVEVVLPVNSEDDKWYLTDGTVITTFPQELTESVTIAKNYIPGTGEENIASGTVDEEYGQIYWDIDENGKLYVEGTGDWRDPYAIYDVALEVRVAPWYENREDIVSAEINTTGTVSTAFLFYGCTNLETVDFTNFDTSALTMMDRTFYGCNSLEKLDLTNFDTSQVTDMDYMFRECWSLTELDLSNFDTSNVRSMAEMFAECGSLKIIDLSSFDMSNVEYAYDMLYNCADAIKIYTPKNCALEIDLPVGGDTSEDWYMADGTQVYTLPMNLEESIVLLEDICGAGTIDEEYGQISWVLSEEGHLTVEGTGDYRQPMNQESTNMEDLLPPWYANRENIFTAEINVTGMTDASFMFAECANLTELDVSGFDTSNVTTMYGMFSGCSSLTSLDLSGFETGNVTDMGEMFPGCMSLTALDLTSFDTSNVEYMDYMFTMCSSLTSLDVSSFNTANVTSMNSMFGACASLTELDLSGFDMSNVTDAEYMLKQCESLEKLEAPLNCSLEVELPAPEAAAVTEAEDTSEGIWYRQNAEQVTLLPQGLTESETLYKDIIAGGVRDKDYGQIYWVIDCHGTLIVKGTGDIKEPYGTASTPAEDLEAPWADYCEEILAAEIHLTGATDAFLMFEGCINMVSADLTNMDGSSLTSMNAMFFECSSLTEVDMTGLDTSNVDDMGDLFYGCSSLTALDLSGFDTGNVVDMYGMFYGCSSLETLNISGFDTSNASDMAEMFCGCSSLTSLDVSGFDTTNVRYAEKMFQGCESLPSLDLSSFDMGKVELAVDMLKGCTNLTTIEAPKNCSLEIALPTAAEDDKWYQPDATVIAVLPQGLTESVTLLKNQIPEVTPPEEEEPSTPVTEVFSDVAEGSWYIDAIQYVYDNGIMSGNGGLFTPNVEVTRAMVVETLYKMEGKPAVEDYTTYDQFSDSSRDHWWANSVAWAMNENIATGDTYYKTFSPEASVTREQFATFLYRYAKGKGVDVTLSKDADEILAGTYVSEYAKEAFAWSVDAGLIKGAQSTDANGNVSYDLVPQAGATRAELATILQRFCEKYHI